MTTEQILQLVLDLLPFLIPILVIQLALVAYALIDLKNRQHIHGSRGMWVVLLILGALSLPSGILIAAVYLAWGRKVEVIDDTD